MGRVIRRFVLTLLLFFPVLAFAVDNPLDSLRDSSALRTSLVNDWFIQIPSRVLKNKPLRTTLDDGSPVEVRVESAVGEFMVVVAHKEGSTYPAWSADSWVLYRKTSDGSPIKIRVFLRSDPYVYVQFRPSSKDKSEMDVVAYDGYIIRSYPIPFAFTDLYTTPLRDVFSFLGSRFPWEYFDVDPRTYEDSRTLVSLIRQRLPGLSYADDGACDDQGRLVYIKNLLLQPAPGGLNCSGFAKWVVDGLIRGETGQRLSIEGLKKPYGDRGTSFTEPFEELRDPFFGLDWTRNLASQAWSILRGPGTPNLEDMEVQSSPISAIILRRGNSASLRLFSGYAKDAGFEIEGLQSLLYTLAVQEPGWLYLFSVNEPQGTAPALRQFYHVGVLIPYFTESGDFTVAVFESAAETSLSALIKRYPGQQINLVRIPVEDRFDP